MTKEEILEMEEGDQAFAYVVIRLRMYKLTLDKVMLENERTKRGYLVTTVTLFTHSRNGKEHTDCFRMYNDQYLFFMTAMGNAFPDVEVLDCRKIKLGERSKE